LAFSINFAYEPEHSVMRVTICGLAKDIIVAMTTFISWSV